MSSEEPAKMLANKQLQMVGKDGKTYGHITPHARITLLDYACCDILIPDKIPPPQNHYKVNLAQTIGGVNLALCD